MGTRKLKNSKSLVSKEKRKIPAHPKNPIYCVGGKYYEQDNDGILCRTTKEVLVRKYGNNVNQYYKDVLGFTFYPDNFKFQQVIFNRYNTFKEFKHKAIKGDWKAIETFLKHVFNEHYNMGLEYFWNLYLHPTQKLPLLALVSEKKGTGKTTFLNFIRAIFGKNVITISSHDLSGNFNGAFSEGYVFVSDEHHERKERKSTAEKIKHYVTADTIRVERKGFDSSDASFYGKFILTSNDEETLTNIEDENRRFWVRQIPKVKDDNFELVETLKDQIPAFLYFLKEEFKTEGKRGQLFFKTSEFQTDASRLIQENSKSVKYREIFEAVRTYFEENSKAENVMGNPTELALYLGGMKKDAPYIRRVLKNEFNMETSHHRRYTNCNGINSTGTPFVFKREDFVVVNINDAIDEEDELPF